MVVVLLRLQKTRTYRTSQNKWLAMPFTEASYFSVSGAAEHKINIQKGEELVVDPC